MNKHVARALLKDTAIGLAKSSTAHSRKISSGVTGAVICSRWSLQATGSF